MSNNIKLTKHPHKGIANQQQLKVMKVIYSCIENGDMKRFLQIPNIEHYIDMEYTDYGWNMVHLASWFKQQNILKYILDLPEGKNLVNALDKNKETPLHLAFFTEGKECIQILMEYGANPEQENIHHQMPIQIMTAPRENQYQTLLDIQRTISNESHFNSLNPYLKKLRMELELEKGSTTVPFEKQNDVTSPIKIGNQILDEDYQFLATNKNSQKYNSKDAHLLSFQSASNNYNDDIIGISNYGSQQNLNQHGQSKLESMILTAKKNFTSDQDFISDNRNNDQESQPFEQITMKPTQNSTKKHEQLEDSEIQDEQKSINLNYFQTRIKQFTSHSITNA